MTGDQILQIAGAITAGTCVFFLVQIALYLTAPLPSEPQKAGKHEESQ